MHFALLKDNTEEFNEALKKLPPGLVDRCDCYRWCAYFRIICLAFNEIYIEVNGERFMRRSMFRNASHLDLQLLRANESTMDLQRYVGKCFGDRANIDPLAKSNKFIYGPYTVRYIVQYTAASILCSVSVVWRGRPPACGESHITRVLEPHGRNKPQRLPHAHECQWHAPYVGAAHRHYACSCSKLVSQWRFRLRQSPNAPPCLRV